MQKRDGCTGKMRHAKRRFALKHIASLKEPGMRTGSRAFNQGWTASLAPIH
jgi:hypothetical protein